MAKTIDIKLVSEIKTKKLIEKISRRIGYKGKAPDLSDPEVCRQFCIRYGEAIAPELRRIDLLRKKSMGHMFTKVVRGSYYNN